MKKIILITLFSISHLAFANDENETTFFSNSASSSNNDIGTVDDPDTPGAPIGEYVLPLIVVAGAIGFYYTRNKVIAKN